MNKVYEFLNKAARLYYSGTPIISDEQFDILSESIGYSELGAKQHEDVEKHLYPMYSLKKWYEDDNSVQPLHAYTSSDISMTPKLDGAAVSLLYIDGVFTRALTRGDGIEGRIVTDKVARLVPEVISLEFGNIVQIVGEVAAPAHVENARNYAAGALNLGSVEDFKTRSLEFFAYGVQPYPTPYFTSDLEMLRANDFSTVQDPDISKIYPTDGIVFRLNSNEEFENLGYTANHPRGAYARKERGETVETTLLAVEWQVGKSGKVTPVAILEPIVIGDALIKRATLNNPGFIEALDLNIGDRVAVRRAGEIIPQVVHKIEG